jgi:hypothetical protein
MFIVHSSVASIDNYFVDNPSVDVQFTQTFLILWFMTLTLLILDPLA